MKATDLKIGDFITGSYKYGCVSGIVKKINKNTVVVNQHSEYYNTYTALLSYIVKNLFTNSKDQLLKAE